MEPKILVIPVKGKVSVDLEEALEALAELRERKSKDFFERLAFWR